MAGNSYNYDQIDFCSFYYFNVTEITTLIWLLFDVKNKKTAKKGRLQNRFEVHIPLGTRQSFIKK